ncbi:MAG TPA: alkaline phosphatase PhoX [Polyangiales bacterium]|nr:alkaline phosphatase PhoX [Polyangiales bacterium]
MTTFRRRSFLGAGGAAASLLLGVRPQPAAAARPASPLQADPKGILDLREGFSYRSVSRAGEKMSDGYRTPGKPDAMGVFPGPTPDTLVLMRNHEVPGVREWGPYFDGQLPPPEAYDAEAFGGVTRLVLDARSLELQRSHLVLTGTHWNCAGGLSPWGWLTCEETFDPRHGYVFLCPATAERVQPPQRIPAYGHFRHEAACVDPQTHIAYLSEDREDSALYRHVPRDPAKPFDGTLQALAIAGRPRFDTNEMKPGEALPVAWVDVPRPDSASDDVRLQAQANGAARFVRGEGLCLSGGELYLCATAGGPIGRGQIFQLSHRDPAHLTLLVQSEDATVLDMPDNITVSPSGHVFVAEDGLQGNYLRHVTASGAIVDVARCALSLTEFAGPCFAPDGKTMFVNLQGNGLTLAIRGPFDALVREAERGAAAAQPAAATQGYLGLGAGAIVLALAALARRRQAVGTSPTS